jgi:hypothetical protein
MALTADLEESGPGSELRTLLEGYRTTALLYVAARLGLADLLADGPQSSPELARRTGAHAPALHRILRGLVALGVLWEEDDGQFALTRLGALLRAGAPGHACGAAIIDGQEYVAAWADLLHTALTGETAFNHAFGMTPWEHRALHPELGDLFSAALREETAQAAGAISAAYDFSPFGTVADVGGGHGSLLAAILKAHPAVAGILFDRAHVVADAGPCLEQAGVAARCRLVGGDFFDRLPSGADACILKSVIHDWDDERSLTILRNCHKAMERGKTLLLVERVVPDRAADDPDTVLLDVHMLAVTGGRERSEAEYRALFAAAGFTLTRIIPTRGRFSIIEGLRS